MKLLLDENISDKIVQHIADLFPRSTHIKTIGLMQSDDSIVWEWARQNDFTLVSKDTDFSQKAIVLGPPPKFIWLRIGNCPTRLITALLRSRYEIIRQFIDEDPESLLVLER